MSKSKVAFTTQSYYFLFIYLFICLFISPLQNYKVMGTFQKNLLPSLYGRADSVTLVFCCWIKNGMSQYKTETNYPDL